MMYFIFFSLNKWIQSCETLPCWKAWSSFGVALRWALLLAPMLGRGLRNDRFYSQSSEMSHPTNSWPAVPRLSQTRLRIWGSVLAYKQSIVLPKSITSVFFPSAVWASSTASLCLPRFHSVQPKWTLLRICLRLGCKSKPLLFTNFIWKKHWSRRRARPTIWCPAISSALREKAPLVQEPVLWHFAVTRIACTRFKRWGYFRLGHVCSGFGPEDRDWQLFSCCCFGNEWRLWAILLAWF